MIKTSSDEYKNDNWDTIIERKGDTLFTKTKNKKQSSKKVEIIYAKRRNDDLIKIIASNNKLKNFIKWKPKFDNLRKFLINTLPF